MLFHPCKLGARSRRQPRMLFISAVMQLSVPSFICSLNLFFQNFFAVLFHLHIQGSAFFCGPSQSVSYRTYSSRSGEVLGVCPQDDKSTHIPFMESILTQELQVVVHILLSAFGIKYDTVNDTLIFRFAGAQHTYLPGISSVDSSTD